MEDEKYEILKIISNDQFLVVQVRNIITNETSIEHISQNLNIFKKLYSAKELQKIS